ncbi:MAG: ABC transporter permease [Amaricoccus sp.]|uniref:ABC transporter permease n=1 Tax=Amaricoccus sp. TaxID=1872485 RepID=UPI0039E6D38F
MALIARDRVVSRRPPARKGMDGAGFLANVRAGEAVGGHGMASEASGAAGRPARVGGEGRALPVLCVVAATLVLWYAFAVVLNAPWARDQAGREGRVLGARELVLDTMQQDRPRLPAPHQVVAELWKTTVAVPVGSKRSLVYHAWVTLAATLAGFGLGAGLGIVLATLIVHVRSIDTSVMPWVISSQTVPILAIAPMIVVVLNSVGVTGLLPKAIISMYLSFFPVAVGMVQGLRSPERMLLDQMRTWNASRWQTFVRLRWPSALPWLFASLKVAVAASLVGAIIGELPTGAVAGLGARMLSGSYYGQTVQIWAALVMASICAAGLVGLVALAERLTFAAMGGRR